MIRVVIADDHAVVRRGLEQLLSAEDDIDVVGTADDGGAAHAMLASAGPDVFLMDLSMPGVDGIEATRRILADAPDAHVLVLTSFSDRQRVLDAIEAGALGYILKDSSPDEIVAAIRTAAGGGSPLDPKAARVLLDSRRGGAATGTRLTDREQEVLRLVADGLANKQIGRRLGITERTVKAHLTSIFATLGVADRTQAAVWAHQHLPDLEQ
jgi:DNA-binding NarL/FixJ family response regulator